MVEISEGWGKSVERFLFLLLAASGPIGCQLEKANMMMLTKEATEKDRSLETHLLVSTMGNNDDKISGERVWRKDGFFRDMRPNLKVEKRNIPENYLLYINQAYLSTVKSGELAMYNHNFIIGQLIPAANQPEDISTYKCMPNEVKLFTCIYDTTNGKFKGIRESPAYIILRGDSEEVILSYGYDAAKAKVLYAVSKEKIPNVFSATCFNKHYSKILNERREKEDHSTLFYFLPSITDRRETINQWRDNVNLTPIDFSVEFIKSFSSKKVKFAPHKLNSDGVERLDQIEMLYGLFRHMAKVSNQKLTRNVDYLNVHDKRSNDEMVWSVSGSKKKRYDLSKFKLTY